MKTLSSHSVSMTIWSASIAGTTISSRERIDPELGTGVGVTLRTWRQRRPFSIR
jgi:hypothetical protein